LFQENRMLGNDRQQTDDHAVAHELHLVLERLWAQEATIDRLAAQVDRLVELAEGSAGPAPPALPEAPEPEDVAPSDPAPRSRWRAGLRPRATRTCAVCRRDAPRESPRALDQAGWTIVGQWGICPECDATGWRLSERGGLPFRQRGSSEA
jgi:hypothetical protein